MSESESIDENVVLVEIVTDVDGHHEIKFNFDAIPEKRTSDSHSEGDDQTTPSLPTPNEKFTKKTIEDDQAAYEFSLLGSEWASTAIGFLEIVPEFTIRNFELAEEQLADTVIKYVDKVANEKEETTSDEGTTLREYSVDLKHLAVIAKFLGRSSQNLKAVQTMSRAALGALVSEYEAFLTGMIRVLAHHNPAILISEDEAVSVKKIQEYGSFDDLMDDLIDEKISDLLQGKSHYQVLKWLEGKFDVNITSNPEMISDFVEICQRRHIIAHAGGIVNRKYINICTEHGLTLGSLPKINSKINVSRRYLRKSTATIFQMGFFILHMIWQKVVPSHKTVSHGNILQVSHDFLENDLTKMCRRVCDFVLSSTSKLEGRTKAYLVINLAQSHLFEKDIEEEHRTRRIEAALRKHDWSMTSPIVDLALCCLRRDFNELDRLTEKAVDDGLTFTDARTWSVFREVRENSHFRKHFSENF